MARYIDADALWKQMFSYYGCINENTAKENYRGVTLMDYEVANLIEDCIDNAPTVDVVPKSEAENLKDLNKQLEIDNFNANMNLDLAQQELDKLAEEYGDLITEKDELFDIAEKQMAEIEQLKIELEAMRGAANSYKMHYEKAKQEVAREIFEDMQSCLIQRHWNGLDIVSFEFDAVKYAELKKKYTESEGERYKYAERNRCNE